MSKALQVLKTINSRLIDAFNFIFSLPIYFLGVGISFLLWKVFVKKKESKQSNWIKSKKLKEMYEDYLKQF